MNRDHQTGDFLPAIIAIVTVSDTRTLQDDRSGQLIEEKLRNAGHHIGERLVVKDDRVAIRNAVFSLVQQDQCAAIIVTGGTGFSARDVTPDAVQPLFEKHIPGFGELFRMLSYQEIGSSTIQSRADAGLCGNTLVFLLPGSTPACRLAMDAIILEQLDNRHKPCNFREIVGR
ncbi:MAG: molybdenum cofactor biosynthesis protein B [Acidobacteria bacterium]|nr:molybdenum cofactor biosynthesis protein B [Acidobacteriota bacterium]